MTARTAIATLKASVCAKVFAVQVFMLPGSDQSMDTDPSND
jgi:hypothetical protein